METNIKDLSDVMPADRCVLFLCDTWNELAEGLQGVNRSLALSLTGFHGVQVYSTLFVPPSELPRRSQEDALNNNIVLIGPAKPARNIYDNVGADPTSIYPNIAKVIPHVTHIVGHAPITARIASALKRHVYPNSKVVLLLHTISEDLLKVSSRLPFKVPEESEIIGLSEEADVVYTMGERINRHYIARFKNRASRHIDNRLMIPRCTKEVYGINRDTTSSDTSNIARLLTVISSCDDGFLQGLDITLSACNKITKAHIDDCSTRKRITLAIGITGGVDNHRIDDIVKQYVTSEDLRTEIHEYDDWEQMKADLLHCDLYVSPIRCEHFGHMTLTAISAGVPVVTSEDLIVSPIISRLAVNPEDVNISVHGTEDSVRQDSSAWRDVIIKAIQELPQRNKCAKQLQTALKRDEVIHTTHDDFVHYILGGIELKHCASHLDFEYPTKIKDLELMIENSVTELMMGALKQSWRLRRHPLIEPSDLYQPLSDISLPVEDLAHHVTDKVERHNRRIVSFNQKSGSYVVYCPSIFALNDLWASCDEINGALMERLFKGDENPVLKHFELKAITIKTNMAGPKLLSYKTEIAMQNQHCLLHDQ